MLCFCFTFFAPQVVKVERTTYNVDGQAVTASPILGSGRVRPDYQHPSQRVYLDGDPYESYGEEVYAASDIFGGSIGRISQRIGSNPMSNSQKPAPKPWLLPTPLSTRASTGSPSIPATPGARGTSWQLPGSVSPSDLHLISNPLKTRFGDNAIQYASLHLCCNQCLPLLSARK